MLNVGSLALGLNCISKNLNTKASNAVRFSTWSRALCIFERACPAPYSEKSPNSCITCSLELFKPKKTVFIKSTITSAGTVSTGSDSSRASTFTAPRSSSPGNLSVLPKSCSGSSGAGGFLSISSGSNSSKVFTCSSRNLRFPIIFLDIKRTSVLLYLINSLF